MTRKQKKSKQPNSQTPRQENKTNRKQAEQTLVQLWENHVMPLAIVLLYRQGAKKDQGSEEDKKTEQTLVADVAICTSAGEV